MEPPLEARTSGVGFVLLFDPPSTPAVEFAYGQLADDVSDACERVVGLPCAVRWAALPRRDGRRVIEDVSASTSALLEQLYASGYDPIFLLPCSFDFGAAEKQWLTELVRGAQRRHPESPIYYDDFNGTHPLLLQSFVDHACRALDTQQSAHASPGNFGLLLIASGAGDADTRSDSYKLMRLLWEQLAVARGEVAFLKHAQYPLPEQLAACARTASTWLAVVQDFWPDEHYEYARLLAADGAGQYGIRIALSNPIGGHRNHCALLTQRCLSLHRDARQRTSARQRSVKGAAIGEGRLHAPGESLPLSQMAGEQPVPGYHGTLLAEIRCHDELTHVLSAAGLRRQPTIVKPTWHGYATGTYTDAAALDALLGSLGPGCTVVEGHTTSRNDGSREFDWERQAFDNRVWISKQEQDYLQKTGLLHTLQEKKASFINVTEAAWDGQCARAVDVADVLEEQGVRLQFDKLLGTVPLALFERRGAPMVSYARFKGPTRLSISNLFGLLPEVLRDAWHGPNITYFARVCCDLARLYGALFELYGVVESLTCAVRWERQGFYRSRWGNYDLVPQPGVVCVSRGLSGADVLAARLQGQDVDRSAFFDVVRTVLGFPDELATVPLPTHLIKRFVG